MKTRYYIPFIIGSVLLCTNLLISCDDDTKLGDPPRLFRPMFDEVSSSGNWISVGWFQYEGATSFVLELSKDTFRTAPIATATVETTSYTFENLLWDQEYQVRIMSKGDNIQSDHLTLLGIKTSDFPTKLTNPTVDDIVDNAIRVKWTVTDEEYTELQLTNSKDEVIETIPLTSEQYSEGEIIINQLEPATTYRVRAYAGNEYKGKRTFTTLAAQEFEGNVVDLRGLDQAEARSLITTAYMAALEDNSTLVLSGGTEYVLNTVTLTNKSVKFVTGYSLEGMAKLLMQSDIRLTANMTIPKIEFENVYLTSYNPPPAAPIDENTTDYGGKYVFNLNQAGVKVNLISFINCQFKYFRGVCRLQAGPVIDKAIVDGCILERIGGYAVLNVDNAAATMTEMVLTNSTGYFVDKVLVNSKSTTTQTVTIDNCTFCNSPLPAGYICDFNGQKPEIKIKNSIFGPGKDNNPTNYFRAGAGSSITSENNYATSGYEEAVNTQTGAKQNGIPDITVTSVGFTNPAGLDFTINDSKFPGISTSGDPRWRP